MPKYSVVIRCCNEEKHIGKLLELITHQSVYTDTEIVIVDSGSVDNTLNIARRYPVKLVNIKPSDFTFGRALNIGIEAASGEIMIIASAHVYPTHEHWIEQLVEPFQNPKVVLSYGGQQGNEVTKYSEHQVFKKWFPPEEEWYLQDHPFCNNANAAIRRSVWQELPYNESLTGLEDLDWAKRALALGYMLAYVPKAAIVHVHEETPARIRNRYRREAIAYKQIFPEASFSFRDFCYLFPSNVLSDWIHAIREGKFWKNFTEIIMFRLMQFWGTYQGYQQRGPVSQMLKRRFYYPNKIR
jgi:glycosyltransferase involved in cell wall biosynthesis